MITLLVLAAAVALGYTAGRLHEGCRRGGTLDLEVALGLATLNAVGLHSDETWAQMEEALDLLALRDRMLGDPDWDVRAHLDVLPTPGVTVDMLTDYALGIVTADYAWICGQLAGRNLRSVS